MVQYGVQGSKIWHVFTAASLLIVGREAGSCLCDQWVLSRSRVIMRETLKTVKILTQPKSLKVSKKTPTLDPALDATMHEVR